MDRIENCASFLLGKAYQQVQRRSRDALAPFGVTPVQFAALSVLWERDGVSAADLGQRLMLDSATMTGIVDRLEGAGFVERRPDPDGDRRIARLHLTAAGRDGASGMTAAMARLNVEIDRLFGDGGAALRAGLRRIAQAGS